MEAINRWYFRVRSPRRWNEADSKRRSDSAPKSCEDTPRKTNYVAKQRQFGRRL